MGNGAIVPVSTADQQDLSSIKKHQKKTSSTSLVGTMTTTTHSRSSEKHTLLSIPELEQRSRSKYYTNHLEEFRDELIEVIKIDDIGRLELLIKCVNVENFLPLHLAIKYSSLECLELLLSAGLSPFAIDKNGSTPLHRAVGVIHDNSILCMYSLLLHAPRCINLVDHKGNTPLHIAITANNIRAVETLLSNGASYSIKNDAGHSPKHLAKAMKAMDIVEMIDCKKAGRPFSSLQAATTKPSPADMERIMKVWERFFENALSGINFNEMDEDDEERDRDRDRDRKVEENDEDEDEDEEEEDSYYRDHKKGENYLNDNENYQTTQMEIYNASCWWFGYVVCYDASLIIPEDTEYTSTEYPPGSTDGYYISSCLDLSEPHRDLDDHLYSQEMYQVWCGHSTAQQEEDYLWKTTGDTWPTNISDTIRRGWITCFLLESNECVWLHLLTYNIERYLPIGHDELSVSCGCEWGDEEGYWLKPPQVTARSWVMIRCYVTDDSSDIKEVSEKSMSKKYHDDEKGNEKEYRADGRESQKSLKYKSDEKLSMRGEDEWKSEGKFSKEDQSDSDYKDADVDIGKKTSQQEVWYYYNRVSGQSSWEQPEGWREIVSLAGGWILCAEEHRIDELYWWNEETEDITWYGEEY